MTMIDRRRVTAALAFTACALPAFAAEPAARWIDYEARLRARLDDAGGGRFERPFADELLALNNRFRRGQGLAALQADDELDRAAQAHAADLIGRDFFAHASPEGFAHGDRCGLMSRRLAGAFAENIAYQGGGSANPNDFFESWRDNPGHRLNMLTPEYSHAGHGVARNGRVWMAVAVFCEVDTRLARALPFRCDGDEIRASLVSAAPALATYRISNPNAAPPPMSYPAAGPAPSLAAGVSRLRPMKPLGDGAFEITWGPIFVA
jgi:uncharacterized protein YkwD